MPAQGLQEAIPPVRVQHTFVRALTISLVPRQIRMVVSLKGLPILLFENLVGQLRFYDWEEIHEGC